LGKPTAIEKFGNIGVFVISLALHFSAVDEGGKDFAGTVLTVSRPKPLKTVLDQLGHVKTSV